MSGRRECRGSTRHKGGGQARADSASEKSARLRHIIAARAQAAVVSSVQRYILFCNFVFCAEQNPENSVCKISWRGRRAIHCLIWRQSFRLTLTARWQSEGLPPAKQSHKCIQIVRYNANLPGEFGRPLLGLVSLPLRMRRIRPAAQPARVGCEHVRVAVHARLTLEPLRGAPQQPGRAFRL